MALSVPDPIIQLLHNRDCSGEALVDLQIAGEIAEVRATLESPSRDEQSGGWAELAAFQFRPLQGDDLSPWNTYFGPHGGAKRQDGSQFYFPDIAEADIEILDYWKQRALDVKHPVLRARYADLVWDFSPYFKAKRDVTHAKMAIDAYLAAVDRRLFVRPPEAVTYLTRALSIALSISDADRQNTSVAAMMRFFKTESKPNHHGTWSFIFDDLLQNKRLTVSEDQEAQIILGLEDILRRTSTLKTADFSPFDAQAAAERLAAYYHKHGKHDDMSRVVRIYGEAFEALSADASSLLATGWLAPVLDAYRNMGMDEDAKRVQLKLAEKAATLGSEMKTISVPLEISPTELAQYLETLTDGTADECLTRVAFEFIPKAGPVRDLLQKMAERTPLWAMISIEKSDDGFTVAKAGSVADDPAGRLLLQLAQYLEGTAFVLSQTLERGISRHSLGADAISTYIYRSPVFCAERKSLIDSGLAAHFAGDYVKAIHVLVPQIEGACRVLLGLLGEPKTRVKGQNKGVLHQKNLNEIFDEAAVQAALREDVLLYFKTFLTEPIGLNLRNRLCHGLMSTLEFTRPLSDRVLHVLLVLAQVRSKSAQPEPHSTDPQAE
jgi:hypothetical protein